MNEIQEIIRCDEFVPTDRTELGKRGDCSDRERITALETRMREQPQIHIETTHHFAPGTYVRQVTIPAGTLLTGKIHKTEHLNIVARGHIRVFSEFGYQDLHAGACFLSKPGTKRVGFALEETVWMTVHSTEETSPEAIEKKITAESYEEYEQYALENKS